MTILLIAGHLRNNAINFHLQNANFSHVFTVLYDTISINNRNGTPFQESEKIKITNFDQLTLECQQKMDELKVMDKILAKINKYPDAEIRPNITYQIMKNRQRLLEMTNKFNIPNDELTILTRPDVEIDLTQLSGWQPEENVLYATKKSAHCEFNPFHIEDIVLWGRYDVIKTVLMWPEYYKNILEDVVNDKLDTLLFCCPHVTMGYGFEKISNLKIKKCDLQYEFGRCLK